MDIPRRRKSEKYSRRRRKKKHVKRNAIKKKKNPEDDSIRGSSEQILRLSCENNNNPANSCDSSKVGISLTQAIFHHVLLKKNDSQAVRTATERQTISKARWLLVLTGLFFVAVVFVVVFLPSA